MMVRNIGFGGALYHATAADYLPLRIFFAPLCKIAEQFWLQRAP